MGVGALEILTGAGCLDILGVETGVDEALAVSAFGAGKDLGVDNASAVTFGFDATGLGAGRCGLSKVLLSTGTTKPKERASVTNVRHILSLHSMSALPMTIMLLRARVNATFRRR